MTQIYITYPKQVAWHIEQDKHLKFEFDGHAVLLKDRHHIEEVKDGCENFLLLKQLEEKENALAHV